MHAAPEQGPSGDSCRPDYASSRCISTIWLWVKAAKTACLTSFDIPFIPAVSQQQLRRAAQYLLPSSPSKDSVELAFAELKPSVGCTATAQQVAVQRCCI